MRQPHGPWWTGRTGSPSTGAVDPTRQPHPRAQVTGRRAPHGGHAVRPKAAASAQPAGGGTRAPMVAGGDHRRGERRPTAHPGVSAATEEVAGAEGGGGVAQVDKGSGVSASFDWDGGVDEVGDGAAKLRKATPRREMVPAGG